MFDEFGKEDDSWRPPLPKWWIYTKKALAYGFASLVIFIIGFLVVRMMLSQPPRQMKDIVWNDSLYSSYTESKAKGEKLSVIQISSTDSFSDDNMMSVYTILYVPELKQLQFTVRYNDRILNYLAQDYPEALDLAEAKKELYTFRLRYTVDGQELYSDEYSYVKAHKGGYTYRRLIFENVDLSNSSIAAMYVDACYVGAPALARNTMFVYKTSFSQLPYDYSIPKSADKNIFSSKD